MNLKIYIATHKKFDVPKSKYHIPLHVGREGKEDLGYLGDNTGDNISLKNANYCELTGFYWIWKNVKDADYVGLCHYRRYFIMPTLKNDIQHYFSLYYKKMKNIYKRKVWRARNLKINRIQKINYYIKRNEKYLGINLEKYDCYLLKNYEIDLNLDELYDKNLNIEELNVLRTVIFEKYPEYIEEYDKFIKQSKLSPCNMIITKKSIFDEYSEWLFDILFEVEKRISISNDAYKSRVFGFLGEYLLNIYINNNINSIKVKKLDMLYVE